MGSVYITLFTEKHCVKLPAWEMSCWTGWVRVQAQPHPGQLMAPCWWPAPRGGCRPGAPLPDALGVTTASALLPCPFSWLPVPRGVLFDSLRREFISTHWWLGCGDVIRGRVGGGRSAVVTWCWAEACCPRFRKRPCFLWSPSLGGESGQPRNRGCCFHAAS